jgi:hypothetical protein
MMVINHRHHHIHVVEQEDNTRNKEHHKNMVDFIENQEVFAMPSTVLFYPFVLMRSSMTYCAANPSRKTRGNTTAQRGIS